MRMSCNGCRVLRKGCSDDCSIRPCLIWIKSADAQANATLFLAKFYGRAGLLNLVNAGCTDAQRPEIFRSLLYEACGRIVNPVYGAVGLLWSGKWQLCQEAVEAVLRGKPIIQLQPNQIASSAPSSAAMNGIPLPPLKAFDIRHIARDDTAPRDLLRVAKPSRPRFKRATMAPAAAESQAVAWRQLFAEAQPRIPSRESSVGVDLDRENAASDVSVETVEDSMMTADHGWPQTVGVSMSTTDTSHQDLGPDSHDSTGDVKLELSLSLQLAPTNTMAAAGKPVASTSW